MRRFSAIDSEEPVSDGQFGTEKSLELQYLAFGPVVPHEAVPESVDQQFKGFEKRL
jgi:hypothetical protein